MTTGVETKEPDVIETVLEETENESEGGDGLNSVMPKMDPKRHSKRANGHSSLKKGALLCTFRIHNNHSIALSCLQ